MYSIIYWEARKHGFNFYPVVMTNIAMENCSFIDDLQYLPVNMVISHSYVKLVSRRSFNDVSGRKRLIFLTSFAGDVLPVAGAANVVPGR